MGGSLTKTRSLQRFFPNFTHENWVQVPAQQLQGRTRYGDLTTLRNIATKQQIDRYQLQFFTDRQQRIYQECFMQRLRQQYLVNAFHYQPIRSSSLCSNVRGAVVYIQHIPIRLSDVTDIPYDESLYILKSSLLGFERLYTESGYFQVMQQHIGIDKQGHVKVWLNADLSKNYPYSFEEQVQQSKDYQRIMVSQIITIVQKNTNFENFQQGYPIFSTYLNTINAHPSFHQTIQILNNFITNVCKVQVPKRCTSVVQIFQEQYGEEFNITSASDFLDHIDVGDNNQVYNNNDVQTQERDRTNIGSSRNNDRGRLNSFQNQNKASTPSINNQRFINNEQVIEPGQASYKQYEPTSTYKPNEKNRKISVEASSNRSSRLNNNQNLKIRSNRNSNNIYISPMNQNQGSNKNSNQNSNKSSLINSRVNEVNNIPIHQQSVRHSGGGLYTNRSHNSNLYRQVDDDFNKICSGFYQNENPASNTSKVNQQLRQSNASKISRHPSIPKITFSYIKQENNSGQIKQGSQQNNLSGYQSQNLRKNSGNSQNIRINNNLIQNNIQNQTSIKNKKLDQMIQKQINQDIQRQLLKSQVKMPKISSGYLLKPKTIHINNKIDECEIQQQIDPQIMRDVLAQFPIEKKAIF